MDIIEEGDLKKHIAKNIKQIRKSLNFSQEALAEKASISDDTISKIEREITVINSLTLIKICNALNVTPNDILKEFININSVKNELYKKINTLSIKEINYLLDFLDIIDSIKKDKKQ